MMNPKRSITNIPTIQIIKSLFNLKINFKTIKMLNTKIDNIVKANKFLAIKILLRIYNYIKINNKILITAEKTHTIMMILSFNKEKVKHFKAIFMKINLSKRILSIKTTALLAIIIKNFQ